MLNNLIVAPRTLLLQEFSVFLSQCIMFGIIHKYYMSLDSIMVTT